MRAAASLREDGRLRGEQLLDADGGQVEQHVELAALKRVSFGSPLHLDEAFGVVHHDVHVGLGLGVLGVVEIEHRLPAEDADRNRGDLPVHGIAGDLAGLDELRGGERQRDVAARDRGRTRAAVGLQDVAVDRDRVLAEGGAVDDRAQAAADEALDLERAPALRAARGFTRRAACASRAAACRTRR